MSDPKGRSIMVDTTIAELDDLRLTCWRAVTSLWWGHWAIVDAGLQVTQTVLATAAPAPPPVSPVSEGLAERALARAKKGLAPPREVYQAPYRDRITWAEFPAWARPCDPELFEGCSHEG
jgi:hypothetical protein